MSKVKSKNTQLELSFRKNYGINIPITGFITKLPVNQTWFSFPKELPSSLTVVFGTNVLFITENLSQIKVLDSQTKRNELRAKEVNKSLTKRDGK